MEATENPYVILFIVLCWGEEALEGSLLARLRDFLKLYNCIVRSDSMIFWNSPTSKPCSYSYSRGTLLLGSTISISPS